MAAARNITIIERMIRTKLGKRIKQFLIVDRKIVSKRWKSIALAAVERREVQLVKVLIMAGQIADFAAKLRVRLLARFQWLAKFSDQAFAEICATVLNRGKWVDVVVRGLAVERFIPDMPEMMRLMADLNKAAKAKGTGWGKVMLMNGLTTRNGRQFADWVVASVHEDGRIWIMALVESKSISNMEELIDKNGRGAGQFLWDYLRAKGEGLVLEVTDASGNLKKLEFAEKSILLEPILQGAKKKPQFPTRFIGVVPERFSQRQLLAQSAKQINIEEWAWPVSQAEMLRLIGAIESGFNVPQAQRVLK